MVRMKVTQKIGWLKIVCYWACRVETQVAVLYSSASTIIEYIAFPLMVRTVRIYIESRFKNEIVRGMPLINRTIHSLLE